MRLAMDRRIAAIVLLILGAPGVARAQAWLPAAREGAVTVTYQGLFADDHLDRNGAPYDRGRTSNDMVTTGFDYGLNDLLAVDAKVNFVDTKHEGADQFHGPLDTGAYHGTIQDARIAVAFRVPTRGFAFAPYVGGILPTHNYETRGHSAPGRRLKALELGGWVGRDLSPILPKAYAQGHYSYSFVEHVGGMSINRSNLDFEGGYSVSSRITAMVAGAIQRTHGGLEFPLRHDDQYDELFPFHDRVARDNYFLMTAGGTFALSGQVSLYGNLVRTISGQNTHRVNGIATGIAWTFGGGLRLGADSSAPSRTAVRAPNF